jgi:hypothetical protein
MEAVKMATTKTRRVRAILEDGSYVLVPQDVLKDFVGIDEENNPIIRCTESPFEGELMGITNCCGATAKGCDGYTGCRSCYREVSSRLGGTYTEAHIYIRAKVGA